MDSAIGFWALSKVIVGLSIFKWFNAITKIQGENNSIIIEYYF